MILVTRMWEDCAWGSLSTFFQSSNFCLAQETITFVFTQLQGIKLCVCDILIQCLQIHQLLPVSPCLHLELLSRYKPYMIYMRPAEESSHLGNLLQHGFGVAETAMELLQSTPSSPPCVRTGILVNHELRRHGFTQTGQGSGAVSNRWIEDTSTYLGSKWSLQYPSMVPVTTTDILQIYYRYITDQGNLVFLTLLRDSTCFACAVLCFPHGCWCVCTSWRGFFTDTNNVIVGDQ